MIILFESFSSITNYMGFPLQCLKYLQYLKYLQLTSFSITMAYKHLHKLSLILHMSYWKVTLQEIKIMNIERLNEQNGRSLKMRVLFIDLLSILSTSSIEMTCDYPEKNWFLKNTKHFLGGLIKLLLTITIKCIRIIYHQSHATLPD